MPVASEDVWRVLYTVSRYLFPLLALSLVLLVLIYILSESASRREKLRGLPGTGTVGELIVLAGGRDLDVNTWFPVPREGVLGSIRSCDLVIPCPGVHTKHLDFSWSDGQGLLIRPRTGCEVLINGTPVTCRTDASAVPLTHGSLLQVGSAVLRLHLFAALDNTVTPVQAVSSEMPSAYEIPAGYNVQPQITNEIPISPMQQPQTSCMSEPYPPSTVPTEGMQPLPMQEGFIPQNTFSPVSVPDEAENPSASEPVRIRRSDRWKEDLGE